MADTSEILRKLESAMPVADKEQEKRLKAGRAIQLQQQVAQAPQIPTVSLASVAQQVGAERASSAGTQQIQQAQQKVQQVADMSKMALGQEQAVAESEIAGQKLALGETQRKAEETVSIAQRQAEDQIFQNQINFKKDELGRANLEQSQLYDLAVTTAKNNEELKNRVQAIQNASAEKIKYHEAISNRLKVILDGDFRIKNQKLDQKSKEYIAEIKRKADETAQKEKAKAANKGAMYSAIGTTVGTVGGAVAGSYFGPAGSMAGATVGASVGGALGGAAGSAVAANEA